MYSYIINKEERRLNCNISLIKISNCIIIIQINCIEYNFIKYSVNILRLWLHYKIALLYKIWCEIYYEYDYSMQAFSRASRLVRFGSAVLLAPEDHNYANSHVAAIDCAIELE